ncbi:MAG: hypothetical protein MIO90_00100 [Methanomassiliicoccales archaeon]|nr:hypothetical protein [Methanomassiliicoccales archaeon]
MKWRSHLSIGKVIADRLELPKGERKAFLDGIVEPDRHKERMNGPGYSYRISHHHPPRRIIMLHIWMARMSLLRNDTYQGYRHLGMALHYLQDKSTSKGFMGISHDRREENLATVPVPHKVIEKGMNKYVSSPEFIERSISLTKPKKGIQDIMVQASFRSAAVAAAVVDTSRRPELKALMIKARRKHALVHVPLVAGSLAVGISLGLMWHTPLLLMPAFPIAVLALYLDRPYRQMKRMAKWNGLRSH